MGMKSMITCLVVGAVMGLAQCAHAAELPPGAVSICWVVGEVAYESTVAEGSALPDGAYEEAVSTCEASVGLEVTP